ncbi:MAG: hypothetical protein PVJ49_14390 [Acidobacteriota bacterium]|jgi:hypothetical protein
MTTTEPHSLDDELIDRSVLRLSTIATSLGLGLLAGLLLFVATLFLALRDGPGAGPHLGLLSQYFPGYSVTVLGSLVGFFYAFLSGALAGFLLSATYNRLAR